MGRFAVEGTLKFAELSSNLLLIVTNREQTDYCHFFLLAHEPAAQQPLVTHKAVYEKGRGDYYQLANLLTSEANVLLDKKKGSDFPEGRISRVGENTSSILYVLNKAKEKVEIIKLDHSRVLKSPFSEERLDEVVYSKLPKAAQTPSSPLIPPPPPPQTAEFEHARVKASLEARAGERSV